MTFRTMGVRGITIVEIAAAAVLAILISLSLLRADLSARYSMRAARIHLEATNVLQSYMEQTRAQSYPGIQDATYSDVVISDAGTTSDDADDITGTVVINVTDNGDDTKTIVGTATWQQRLVNQEITKSIALTTLASEP